MKNEKIVMTIFTKLEVIIYQKTCIHISMPKETGYILKYLIVI